jgi:hypothetical protein
MIVYADVHITVIILFPICLFLNPIVQLLLFCLYMSIIPITCLYQGLSQSEDDNYNTRFVNCKFTMICLLNVC